MQLIVILIQLMWCNYNSDLHNEKWKSQWLRLKCLFVLLKCELDSEMFWSETSAGRRSVRPLKTQTRRGEGDHVEWAVKLLPWSPKLTSRQKLKPVAVWDGEEMWSFREQWSETSEDLSEIWWNTHLWSHDNRLRLIKHISWQEDTEHASYSVILLTLSDEDWIQLSNDASVSVGRWTLHTHSTEEHL